MTERYAIAIDVGATFIKCGLINTRGEIVYRFKMPSRDLLSEGEVIALINIAIRKCMGQAGGNILGVGIGFPGIVENNVIVGGADNLPGFKNVDLGAIIAASSGLTIIVDNDANMMAWGEMKYGAGKHCSDVVFLTVGTGIGGSLLINNKLYGGYHNRGTEFGHITLNLDGPLCTCGSQGCFEIYASVKALIKNYANHTNHDPALLNGEIIIKNYLQGELQATEVMEQHFHYMAAGIASLVNIFSPQKVVVGGGITDAGDFYIVEISKRVERRAMPDAFSRTEIVHATMSSEAGLLGCASRIFATPMVLYSNT